jgi:phosphatidylglycerophosphatase A
MTTEIWARRLATVFGCGYSKKAPGTMGSLAALPFAALVALAGPYFYMAITILLFPIGLWAAEMYERTQSEHDSQEIVIDEVLGQMIALVWLPLTWQSWLAGFILFRFFDILKPFPISWMDKNIKGGLGVIADDVAAGIAASLILQLVYTHTNWLGAQLLI